MNEQVKTTIIGAGVTGLCAANYLAEQHGHDAILVLEAAAHVGGASRTETIDGFQCDHGPNGFLDREPRTLEWLELLGIGDNAIRANENAAHRFILKNEKLIEILPPPAFLISPLLSVSGRIRLLCEPFIAGKKDDTPESIWNFAARRIGPEAADTLVACMVSGIFGGDAKQLSLAHCFPKMAQMERDHGGLYKAMRAKKKQESGGGSPMGPAGVLTSFPDGIGYLAQCAAQHLRDRLRPSQRVTRLTRANATYRIETNTGDTIETQNVILATPAYAAAEITKQLDPELAQTLDKIEYASITVLCTGFKREAIGHPLDGFGFLVPSAQKKRMLGCIWTSSIFPKQAPENKVLFRTMYGGFTDPEALNLTDTQLMDYFKQEIHPLLDIQGDPDLIRIYRHPRGIPQYLLHHGDSLAAIEAAEKRNPGLVLAGNAYRGVSLNDCVLSAHRAIDMIRN